MKLSRGWKTCFWQSYGNSNWFYSFMTTAFLQISSLVLGQIILVSAASECFQPSQALETCAQKNNWEYAWYVGDYDFGFGPLEVTQAMCRFRWHVKAIKCVRDRMSRPCSENLHSSKLAWTMWSIVFDPAPFKKAADYLCADQNLNIFLQNQDKCLSKQKAAAMQCKEEQNLLAEVLANTKTTPLPAFISGGGGDVSFPKTQYNDHMKSLLLYYRCHRTQRKLRCLFNILYKECPSNVVILIMNYFKELMSDDTNCHFQQIATDHERRLRLFQEQQLQQMQQHQRPTEGSPKLSRETDNTQGAAKAAHLGGKQPPNNSNSWSRSLFHMVIILGSHVWLWFILGQTCLF